MKSLVYGQGKARSNLEKWRKEDGEIPLYPLQFNLIPSITVPYCTILCRIWITSISSVVTHLCYFIHSPKKEQRKIFMLSNVLIVVFLDMWYQRKILIDYSHKLAWQENHGKSWLSKNILGEWFLVYSHYPTLCLQTEDTDLLY